MASALTIHAFSRKPDQVGHRMAIRNVVATGVAHFLLFIINVLVVKWGIWPP
jgi:hypothetical protein